MPNARSFKGLIGLLGLLAALATSPPSQAGGVAAELRAGIDVHNVDGSNGEDGFDAVTEIYFAAPTWRFQDPMLNHLFSPRPFTGFSVNSSGDTNELFAGVAWQLPLTERLFFESSFGGAVHDGPLDDPLDASYGCRVNFRESAGLGMKLSPNWRLLIGINHMSNGNLCGRNRGLTNAGVRLGYVFD